MGDLEIYTESLGRVLRSQRKDKGFFHEKLARRVELDRTYISLLERSD
jgi:ribosome-binding protein aMBF1 (putative translation factor)|tara:strand:+ start:20109 stop:20252 length:144 start_codon:yes stop_codon:yes gene_type:complete